MKKNSDELRGFVTGLVLGDARIDKGVEKRALYIASIYKDFIEQIDRCFSDFNVFKTRVRVENAYSKNDVNHKTAYRLYVKAHPYFAKIYHQFYDDFGGRRVTEKALSWLTPHGIANWFMSDGYVVLVGKTKGKIVDRRVEIATDRYPEAAVDKIIEYFENECGYTVKKIRRKPGMYRIRFSLKSAQYLFLMIEPYIVDSMMYKINMRYDYQPKWMCDEYYELMCNLNSADNP